MSIRTPLFLLLLLAFPYQVYGQHADEIVIGHTHSIDSQILSESRSYSVSLPTSYDHTSRPYKTYPILIVLDGQSLFEPISGMLNFMSASRNGSRRVPEMIIVGVASTNRERDFTPDKIVTRRKNDTGGGDQFLAFLEEELLPLLHENYRTSPYTVLVGHSLGGLFASHVYMKQETAFNGFIAIDPSFGTWDVPTMDQKIDATTRTSFGRFLYIATANWGSRNLRNRDRHVRFYEALNRKNGAGYFRAQLDYYEEENHGSVPLMAFYNGISAMFEGHGLTYRDVRSVEQVISHYATLSDRLSYEIHPPEALINRAGYQMLRSDEKQLKAEALALFELNATNYPQSYNAFDSLGEAYSALGNTEQAILHYRKSLALNPDNDNARQHLKALQKP